MEQPAALTRAYLEAYKKVVLNYLPAARITIELVAKNYDLTMLTNEKQPASSRGKRPGRDEFITYITNVMGGFIGTPAASALEKELRDVKIEL